MDMKKIIIAVIIVIVVAFVAFSYISANTHEARIEVLSNSTLKNGDLFVFVLKDNYRNVIPNQPVDIKILDDSGWATKYNVTTDSDGKGYVKISSLDNGNYTVHTSFNGTMFLTQCKSVTNLAIDDGYEDYDSEDY